MNRKNDDTAAEMLHEHGVTLTGVDWLTVKDRRFFEKNWFPPAIVMEDRRTGKSVRYIADEVLSDVL